MKINQNKLNSRISQRISKYNEVISEFLLSIGINYKISFTKNPGRQIEIQMTFVGEQDETQEIDNLSSYLSFGERNIITAMFFLLYESSTEETVYLFDDPVTLFDETKRFAFLHLLYYFKFKMTPRLIKANDYVILLTHSFSALKEALLIETSACYLATNEDFILELDEIKKKDISNYYQKTINLIKGTENILVKLVLYRNLIQTDYISDPQNRKYNYISSLTKLKLPGTKGGVPFTKERNEEILSDINKDNLGAYTLDIKKDELIAALDTKRIAEAITKSTLWYEKIILFRILIDSIDKNNATKFANNKIIRRFITSLFHVETSKLFDLASVDIKAVPNYVIELIESVTKEVEVELDKHMDVSVDFSMFL